MTALTPIERQSDLLAQAGPRNAGGGTGLFVLAPELNLVVERKPAIVDDSFAALKRS